MNFQGLLKNIRNTKKITLRSLDNKIKIKHSTLSNFETGKLTPNSTHFIKLCEGLQVTYNELKQLHIEYEKLIKPTQAQELIYLLYKSKHIFSLLLDGTPIKDYFLEIYDQINDFFQGVLYQYFLDLANFVSTKALNQEIINAKSLYNALDLLKKGFNKIFEIHIEKNVSIQQIKNVAIINEKELIQFLDSIPDFFNPDDYKLFKQILNNIKIANNLETLKNKQKTYNFAQSDFFTLLKTHNNALIVISCKVINSDILNIVFTKQQALEKRIEILKNKMLKAAELYINLKDLSIFNQYIDNLIDFLDIIIKEKNVEKILIQKKENQITQLQQENKKLKEMLKKLKN